MSPNSNNVCLLGYSGHGLVVAEVLSYEIEGKFAYAEAKAVELNPFELKYAGFEVREGFPWHEYEYFALGVGDNRLREKISERIKNRNKKLLRIVHPQAHIGLAVKIEDGSFIARGACVNSLTNIGEGVIVNTAAVVEHECVVHAYAHVAPGAVLAGNVTVGRGAFVGANAVVKQGVTIGAYAVIGAGSVVLKDVVAGAVYAGNPARKIYI